MMKSMGILPNTYGALRIVYASAQLRVPVMRKELLPWEALQSSSCTFHPRRISAMERVFPKTLYLRVNSASIDEV